MDQSSCVVREAELAATNVNDSDVATILCRGTRVMFTGIVSIARVCAAGGG